MRKITVATVLLLAVVSMFSCKKKTESGFLGAERGIVNMNPVAGTARVKIFFSEDWTLVSDPSDWCEITPTSGSPKQASKLDSTYLVIKVTANPSTSERRNKFSLNSAGLVLNMLVNQYGSMTPPEMVADSE